MKLNVPPDNADRERFRAAIERFDEANTKDPNVVCVSGVNRPQELVYAERLTAWVLRLNADASEALCLAARCQHLRRWKIPRSQYPRTRAGYLKWRTDLRQFHAEQAGEILRDVGYGEEVIGRVRELNLKQDLAGDPECQALEDALCLVFLEFQFADLAARTDEMKMIGVVRKTWAKMSEAGRSAALRLSYPAPANELLRKALADV